MNLQTMDWGPGDIALTTGPFIINEKKSLPEGFDRAFQLHSTLHLLC